MQTENVLAGHHHVDILGELVHDDPLDQPLFESECEYKAAGGHIVDLLPEAALLRYGVHIDVFIHKEILELCERAHIDEAFRHVGDQVEQAVLADAEDALGVRAVLRRIPVEHGHAHVNNVQIVIR